MLGKFIDMTGQVFGRLTILEISDKDSSGKLRWKCLCGGMRLTGIK